MHEPWYRDGLRFACTQCGNCCSGPPGAVWFTPTEGRAMAAALALDEATFLDRYARPLRGRRSLREVPVEGGFDCVFLDRETSPGRALCSVYAARPEQCRTWPFWPEHLESPSAWADAKRRTPCPGMDSGPVRDVVVLTVRGREDLDGR